MDEGQKSVIRFKLDDRDIIFNDLTVGAHSSNPGRNEGDFIIIKSDGFPTYHFAHVVDDHLMRVSHVLRGQEWLLSTPKHIAIFEAFGWKPPQYAHMPLICNLDGTKISKRQNDIDVLSYRDRGYFAETLLVYLSSIGGGLKENVLESKEFFASTDTVISKLTKLFDETRISNRSVKLNQELLDRLNRRFLQIKLQNPSATSDLIAHLKVLLKQNIPSKLSDQCTDDAYLKHVLNWSTERIYKINDLTTDADFSFLWTDFSNSCSLNEIDEPTRLRMLELIEFLDSYLQGSSISEDLFKDRVLFKKEISGVFKELKQRTKFKVLVVDKKGNYWQMIRFLLTGNVDGPPVFEICNLLDRKNIIYRLGIARKILEEKSV